MRILACHLVQIVVLVHDLVSPDYTVLEERSQSLRGHIELGAVWQ